MNDKELLIAQASLLAADANVASTSLVTCLRQWDSLLPLADDWNSLARGNPLHTCEWLGTWWKHYCANNLHQGHRAELFVLCVFRQSGELIGVAPWFIEHVPFAGRVLRFLGSGEVCTDYLTLLTQPGDEYAVAEAVAKWLMDPAARDTNFWTGSRDLGWDQLDWDCVLADDPALLWLREQLDLRGTVEYVRPNQSCWRVAVPANWADYTRQLSKPFRRKVRRLQNDYTDTGRAVLHLVENVAQLEHAWRILADLHQKRRKSLGDEGCFASSTFESFHLDAARQMLEKGTLRLFWLELDGQPIAIEYAFQGRDSLMAYQSGIDPAFLEYEPGNLMTIELLKRQSGQGGQCLDFMRGDEPYKARWRAQPQATVQVRVLPGRGRDQLRRAWWQTRDQAKSWIKRRLRPAPRPSKVPQPIESE